MQNKERSNQPERLCSLIRTRRGRSGGAAAGGRGKPERRETCWEIAAKRYSRRVTPAETGSYRLPLLPCA